jgi:iron complex outermembrane receptor protein
MLAAMALAIAAPTVSAQSTEAAPADSGAPANKLNTVIVTGTRSTTLDAAESPAPVQILSAADIQTAAGNADLLEALAQVVPSLTAEAFGFDTGNQTLLAKLRGLSPNHVLVLVNGKRRHTTSNLQVDGGVFQGGAGVDLNFIPVDAIDHIEVLTEGAAAQYGTDAIAGVINIILKKKTSGGDLNTTYGHYMDGGGVNTDFAGNYGFKPADGAYFNITGEVHNHGHSQRGGIDPRVIDPAITNPASGGTYPDTNIPNAPGYPYVNQIDGDVAYNLNLAMFNAGFNITDDIQFYAFGSYGHKDAASYENYRLPDKVVYTDPVTKENTYLYPFGFNPEEAAQEQDFSITGGVKGKVIDWNWDLSTVYGNDHSEVFTRGSANAVIYANTGATPIDFYDGFFRSSQMTSTMDFSRDFNVSAMASPLNVAFGFEDRVDKYAIGAGTPDSYLDGGAQSYPGFTPTDAGHHSRINYAGYVDFSGKPIDKLYVDIAGRYEHYSDFGSATVGKITARYDFSSAYAVRGTFSNGFRAPTLAEEYYSSTNVGPSTAFVQLPPNSAGAGFLGLGNGLQPEKSTSISLGFVFRPTDKLTGTVDFYQTIIRNRIVGTGSLYGTVNGVPTANATAINDAIAANGNQLDPDVVKNGTTGINLFTNGITTMTRGVDFVLDYPVDYHWDQMSLGRVDYSIGATYNITSIQSIIDTPAPLAGQSLFSPTSISDLTTAAPRYVMNFGAKWTHGKYSVNLLEKVYGPSSEVENDDGDNAQNTVLYYNTKIGLTPITNLDVGYQATKELKLDVGAINLLNHYPAHVNSTILAHERAADDNAAVDIYAPFSPFGFDGGYYYAKATYRFF